jgi:hypothetical protein
MEWISAGEFRIDIYIDSSPNIQMRITHLPTGTTEIGMGVSRFKLKQELMAKISQTLNEMKAKAE